MNEPTQQIYERLLVLRCKTGDEEAFTELVTLYSPRLRYFLRKLSSPQREPDDLLQEVWATAFRALPRLNDAAAFPAWIYRIARDRALGELRRVRGREGLLVEPEEASGPAFPAETAERIHAALETLPAEHREVLVLRFLEEMSYEEIARVTGCRLGTVRSRLHYGKRALRAILENHSTP
jgi:RNA polymerase sigma-70 factor (ECF subfamily)